MKTTEYFQNWKACAPAFLQELNNMLEVAIYIELH